MTDEVVLLLAPDVSSVNSNVARLLTFFGLRWRILTSEKFLTQSAYHESSSKLKVVCSSDVFLAVTQDLEANRQYEMAWHNCVHSAFIYSGDDAEALRRLVSVLTQNKGAAVQKIDSYHGDLVVSERLNEFCGVMAGLRVARPKEKFELSVILNTREGGANNIISLDHGGTFLKLEYKGVAVFLSTCRKIIDISAELTSQNFDVREHFLSTVPLVLYLKWAFAEVCWSAPETNACLVIDDPVLKSRHGFVNFRELLSLMKRHNFSTNIAFIPWNWRRSTPEIVRLFRENPERYSLSVHGCDHTREEFGSSDQRWLYWTAQQALERMNRHESTTGLRHDRVMVFPHGVFSEAATNALKHTEFIAAVTNDIIGADSRPRTITIADVWEIAVMRYNNFAIFTRRYPWEGIENFAFDALLGKPAMIVIHHDYCSDDCLHLIDFIKRMNALNIPPTWRSLREVVRRSYRQRELSSNEVEIEMYAAQLRFENRSGQSKRFLIRRRESEPSVIREISDGSGSLAWNSANGYINFEIELSSGESKIVAIKFHELAENGPNGGQWGHRFNAMLRRYLCEIRDNYVTTTKLRLASRLGIRDQKSEVKTR